MTSRMLPKNKKEQFSRTLQNIKNIQIQSEKQMIKFSSMNEMQKSIQDKMKRLHEIYKKGKVDYLVKVFIQKLKRNIRPKELIKYENIQGTFQEKQKKLDFIKTLVLPDFLKSLLILINTICVFVIQTLSISQATFFDFQNLAEQSKPLKILKGFIIAQFFVKILLSLTTEYVITEATLKKMKKLLKLYFKTMIFVFDFMLFISAVLIFIFPKSVPVGICAFIISTASFSVLERNVKMIEIAYINTVRKKQYWDLMKILFFNIWSIQIFVAIMTSMVHYDPYYNWIQKAIRGKNLISNPPWYVIYIYAIYWTITTLASLGYGDFTENNILECIMMTLIVFVGYIFFAYNVSAVSNILANLGKLTAQRDYDMAIFKRMLKKQKVESKQIQVKVLNYLSKSAAIQSEYQFLKRKQLLQKLPKKLRQQYMKEASKIIFSKIPFFKYLCQKTLITFSQNIVRHIFYPGQNLTKNTQKLINIMILKHGKIGYGIYRPNSIMHGLILQERTINEQVDNPFLLNKYLLTRHKQINYQIVAKDYCFIYILSFQTFRKCLAQNSKDHQFFFSLYNKMEYTDRQWDKFECQYCSPRRHTIFQCPKLHYIPYKTIIIGKYILQKSQIQNRKRNFKRLQNKITKFKKKKCLLFWKKFYKNYSKLCEQNQEVKIQDQSQILEQNEQFINKTQSVQNKKIKSIYQNYSNYENYRALVEMLNQQFMRNQLDLYDENLINVDSLMDKMHNFTYYFPDMNPIHFKQTSLSISSNLKKDPRYVRNQWIQNK